MPKIICGDVVGYDDYDAAILEIEYENGQYCPESVGEDPSNAGSDEHDNFTERQEH